MSISINPIGDQFAAEILRDRPGLPLDEAHVAAIWQATTAMRPGIRNQSLGDANCTFCGPIWSAEIGAALCNWTPAGCRFRRSRHLQPRRGQSGAHLHDRRRLDSLGNRLWHTDRVVYAGSGVLGMLHAVACPTLPVRHGETEFADMRAAMTRYPDATKAAINDLVVEHDIFWSRAQVGFTDFPQSEKDKYPPSPQRLVAPIRDRNARHYTCRRMARISLAGRWRMVGCCCLI